MSHHEDRSVYPMDREHVTDGSPCWCDPRVMQLCPICNGEGEDAECEYCRDPYPGLVPAYTSTDAVPTITVHNDVEKPDWFNSPGQPFDIVEADGSMRINIRPRDSG
jgi:hypothetical protein